MQYAHRILILAILASRLEALMLGDRTVIPASRDPNTKQELSAARHAGDLGRIFFDHDALCVTEINSRSTAGLRPEVARC